MGKFIITLMSVALLGAVMGMLSPEGDMKKYVRLVGSLCLLCALASPLYGLLSEGEISFEHLFSFTCEPQSGYEDIYKQAIAEGARENAETALKAKLAEQFKLSEDSLDVSLTLGSEADKYFIESARVYLHSSAVFADPRDISAYINETCGCVCTVEYDQIFKGEEGWKNKKAEDGSTVS